MKNFFFILIFSLILIISKSQLVSSEDFESIFVAPDVFITSKIKPTQNFEGDRGNILFESHELEKSNHY